MQSDGEYSQDLHGIKLNTEDKDEALSYKDDVLTLE